MDIPKDVNPSTVPQITVSEATLQGSFPLGPSEKLDRKSAPRSRNLKNKAIVFCSSLKIPFKGFLPLIYTLTVT